MRKSDESAGQRKVSEAVSRLEFAAVNSRTRRITAGPRRCMSPNSDRDPGPRGNTIGVPSISASMLTPSCGGGRTKLSVRPKVTGYDSRTLELIALRNTSASSRKVAVSDQSSALAVIVRPPRSKPLESILVNGHGPAMQDARALRNSLPVPASSVMEPSDAFHRPSGEQGACRLHGTLPWFTRLERLHCARDVLVAFRILGEPDPDIADDGELLLPHQLPSPERSAQAWPRRACPLSRDSSCGISGHSPYSPLCGTSIAACVPARASPET